jgi:PAS domain S-box-containing protein
VLKEFETVLKTTTDGFWITSVKDNGQLLFVNDAYCSMIGYTREELLKMNIGEIDAFQSPEVMKNYFSKIIETGHDRFITKHRTKSGEILDIKISVTYLKIHGGRFYVFVNDITREQRMNRNIISQNEKLYEIAFLQSHQVRTLIVNVLGIINLINFENPNDPENPELILALKTATIDFDSIIRKIVSKTHEIDKLRNEDESLDNLV